MDSESNARKAMGGRIKKVRKAKGLTQKSLGKMLNVEDATISRYESGDRQPDTEMLRLIADTLDVAVDYLLGRTDTQKLRTKGNVANEFDYSQLFTQQDEGQAYILAAELRSRYKLSDETFLKIITEIGRYYNRQQQQMPTKGKAAHGPNTPGTGAFTKEDLDGGETDG